MHTGNSSNNNTDKPKKNGTRRHTHVDEFEKMLHEAIERYRGVLEELAEVIALVVYLTLEQVRSIHHAMI